MLTVYLSGTDLYAHIAKEGPDAARSSYLEEIVDPALAKLVDVRRRKREKLAALAETDSGTLAES